MRVMHLIIGLAALTIVQDASGSDANRGARREVGSGAYLIELPEREAAKGAFIFFHGYKGSADRQMRDRRLVETVHKHGLAFVAPDGLQGTWSHPNAPGRYRDEQQYVEQVLDDLRTRFGFNAGNVLIGGFSQGASMAWYTLCQQGHRVAGAVPFSGVFWAPLPDPESCVSDLPPIVHFHGAADRTFPLEGRVVGRSFRQGDTFKSAEILSRRAGCDLQEDVAAQIGGVGCKVFRGCTRGEVAVCVHDGAHDIRSEHLDAALTEIGF